MINPANGHAYLITPTPMTWVEAEAYAVSVGGHLATVNDAAEQAWLNTTFLSGTNVTRQLWIGFNDAPVEGQFRWSSGETSTFTNWSPNEPSNLINSFCSPQGEDYCTMNWFRGENRPGAVVGQWNDTPVQGTHFGFCVDATHPGPKGLVEIVSCCPGDPDLTNPVWSQDLSFAPLAVCQSSNNCYNYATNRVTASRRNPGSISGADQITAENVIAAAVSDGLVLAPNLSCTAGGCLVALGIKPHQDYHWWRLNADGSWSEKPGCTPARISASMLPRPQTRSGYAIVAYFCVPCGFQLPSGTMPPPDDVPSNAVRVTVGALSGLENPHFDTTDSALLNLLRSAVTTGQAETPAAPSEGPGFSGFSVDVGASVTGLPLKIEVRAGQVQYQMGQTTVARADVLHVASTLESLGAASGWGCMIRQRCRADINCDGSVTLQDVFEFLTAWFSLSPSADYNGVGGVSLQDIFDYLGGWFAGCE